MDILNRNCSIHDFEQMRTQLNYLKYIGYHTLNVDAVYKYCRILYSLERKKYIQIKNNTIISTSNTKRRCLDVGGGISPIHFSLSKIDEIFNVDLSFKGWFPNVNKIYTGATKSFKYDKNNIHYIESELLKYLKTIPDNYFDYIVDGCSLIHMLKLGEIKNNGKEYMNELSRVLKTGGHFMGTCDIANPIGEICFDMIYSNDLSRQLETDSLKLCKPYDYSNWDSYLQNKNNAKPRTNNSKIADINDKSENILKKMMYTPFPG